MGDIAFQNGIDEHDFSFGGDHLLLEGIDEAKLEADMEIDLVIGLIDAAGSKGGFIVHLGLPQFHEAKGDGGAMIGQKVKAGKNAQGNGDGGLGEGV